MRILYIYILSTNRINDIDPVFIQLGRIDMILPVGSISWKSRYLELIKTVNELGNAKIKSDILGDVMIKENNLIGTALPAPINRFLERTNFLSILEFRSLLRSLFSDLNIGSLFLYDDSQHNVTIDRILFDFHETLVKEFSRFVRYCPCADKNQANNHFYKKIIDATIWNTKLFRTI